MKLLITAVIAVGIAAAIGWFVLRARKPLRSGAAQPNRANPETFQNLRRAALTMARAEMGIPAQSMPTASWAALMEIGDVDFSYTVFGVADGTASIYLSNGGGYIGGGERYEKVRKAAMAFVAAAQQSQSRTKATTEFPLPKNGETIFYLRTDAGVFTGAAQAEELAAGRHPLSSLFFAGQELMTQYRLAVPQ